MYEFMKVVIKNSLVTVGRCWEPTHYYENRHKEKESLLPVLQPNS